jgi:hypothetical protein
VDGDELRPQHDDVARQEWLGDMGRGEAAPAGR